MKNVPAPSSFWLRAEAEPGRLALVEPDGRAWTAGALAARANRLVHALRARGLGHGDAVAVLLPNGEPLLSTLLAVMQAGWHWVPINTSLTASGSPSATWAGSTRTGTCSSPTARST